MILSGHEIFYHCIIEPFSERSELLYGERKFTFGCGPAGYDVRVEFDAKEIWERKVLQPGQFMLASTIEHFTMPKDILGEVKDKSSWARRGLAVQNTVIEPGWRGHLTLELTNHGDEGLEIHRGQPIAQIIFHLVYGLVTPYDGKYQDQARGPQDAR